MITIGPPLSNDSILYGGQVPIIPPVKLLTVEHAGADDTLVYHFRATYDRIVFLEENGFAQARTRQSAILPGDSLWQCAFNETLIEGYIYVSKPNTTDLTNIGNDMANDTNTVRLPTLPYVVKLLEGKCMRDDVTGPLLT